MAKEDYKKSFVLHKDLIVYIEVLSNIDAGILFKAILDYVNDNPIEISEKLTPLYIKIITQIEQHWSTYNPKTKRFHWNYKGGITPENKTIRESTEMKIWRLRVFERDNYTCQECLQRGGILNAHHIKPFATHPELRTELSNGLTLCKPCHIKIHKKNG